MLEKTILKVKKLVKSNNLFGMGGLGVILVFANNSFFCYLFYSKLKQIVNGITEKTDQDKSVTSVNSPSKSSHLDISKTDTNSMSTQNSNLNFQQKTKGDEKINLSKSQKIIRLAKKNTILTFISIISTLFMFLISGVDQSEDAFFL